MNPAGSRDTRLEIDIGPVGQYVFSAADCRLAGTECFWNYKNITDTSI